MIFKICFERPVIPMVSQIIELLAVVTLEIMSEVSVCLKVMLVLLMVWLIVKGKRQIAWLKVMLMVY